LHRMTVDDSPSDDSPSTVAISPHIITPVELEERLSTMRSEIHHAWGGDARDGRPPCTDPLRDGVERLRQAVSATAAATAPRHRGVRGSLAGAAKTAIRRLLYWYVEPPWTAQRGLDEAVVRHAEATIGAIESLTAMNAQTSARL